MYDEKEPQVRTESDHDVAIFIVRVDFVVELQSILIQKDRLGFFERNAVVLLVGAVLL